MIINNFKKISNFLEEAERLKILDFINNLQINSEQIKNPHIGEISSQLNGSTYMFDLSQTKISKYLSTFHSSEQVFDSKLLPNILLRLTNKISSSINIPVENCFLQIIKMNKGGKIVRHYDATYPGFINYKCNISLISEDYTLFTNGENIDVKENDLYCFEASLFSHWTDEFKKERILLSYGFGLDYEKLDRLENDPRVRMSNRIFKYFQS